MFDVKKLITQDAYFVDVFFDRNLPQSIRDFFAGAKPIRKSYEDKTFFYNAYTSRKKDCSIVISAEKQLQMHIQSRYDYVERFKRSKYADISLVDSIISSKSEKIVINSHFHVGDLLGDYAQTRINSFGKDDYHDYQGTIDQIQKIVSKAQSGAILRVWYGHNARDLCGFMYLLDKTQGIDCTIIELELPDEVHRLNAHKIKGCRYWGQIRPKEMCIPISTAKILTNEKRNELLARWQKLVFENTEYRIYENGNLKSVDFEYLRAKAIPLFYKGKFSLSKLTGRFLKNEDAFKDLCVVSVIPNFIYRLIDAGDLEFLGRRVSILSSDCWIKSLH